MDKTARITLGTGRIISIIIHIETDVRTIR